MRQSFDWRGLSVLLAPFFLSFCTKHAIHAESSAFCRANEAELADKIPQVHQTLLSLTMAESQKKAWEESVSTELLPTADPSAEKIFGSQIDLRPPMPLLRFLEDLNCLEQERLPVPQRAGQSLYVGLPTDLTLSNMQLWSLILQSARNSGIVLSHFEPAGQAKAYTSWKVWDEPFLDLATSARYSISLVKLKKAEDVRRYLKISLLQRISNSPEDLQTTGILLQGGRTVFSTSSLMSEYQNERQLKLLTNTILAEFEKLQRLERAREFLKRCDQVEVNYKLDIQNRPQFIVEAPFEVVWELMPKLLSKCYISTTNDRTKLEMNCAYLPPERALTEKEQAEGFCTLDLLPNTYLLQFVDLGDQTALQWCSSKNGAVLMESEEIFGSAIKNLLAAYKARLLDGHQESESLVDSPSFEEGDEAL